MTTLRRFHGVLGRNPATAILVSLSIGVIAAGIAAGTFFRGESTRRIVTQSPCVENPNGRTCQSAKRDSDREQKLRDACISPRKFLTDDAYRDETSAPTERRPLVAPRRLNGQVASPIPARVPDPQPSLLMAAVAVGIPGLLLLYRHLYLTRPRSLPQRLRRRLLDPNPLGVVRRWI